MKLNPEQMKYKDDSEDKDTRIETQKEVSNYKGKI